jgi:hypothetical protein
MAKKHPNQNVPKSEHRPRSLKHSLSEKLKVAQQSSLRQRPPAPITLAQTPWENKA